MIPSAALPCWRMGRGFAGHKLVGHAEDSDSLEELRKTRLQAPAADELLEYSLRRSLGVILLWSSDSSSPVWEGVSRRVLEGKH